VHALDSIEGLRRRSAGVGYPCANACSRQVEKYDSDSSGDCSEGEVRNEEEEEEEEEEEDGAQLASAHYARTADGLTRFLLSCFTYVLPSAFSMSFTDDAQRLLEFGLGPTQQRRRALCRVVRSGACKWHVRVLAGRVARLAWWNCPWRRQWVGHSLVVVLVSFVKAWRG